MKHRATATEPADSAPFPEAVETAHESTVERLDLVPATEGERAGLESLARLFTPVGVRGSVSRSGTSLPPEANAPRRVLRTGVERVETRSGKRYAILDRSNAVAGVPREERVLGLFDDAATAELVASALAAASTTPFDIGDHAEREGFPLSHGGLPIGHVRDHDPGLPERLRLAHDYASNLDSLAQLLESLGASTLDFLGRALARRADRAG